MLLTVPATIHTHRVQHVSPGRFLWLIKYTFHEKFPSKSCAIAVQGIEISSGFPAFSKSGLTMGTVFVPRRPRRSQGSWARCTMSDTFYGLHFSKHRRRKEGALSAKYSREGLYGFLKGAQNRWSEKMLAFHCALCLAWFAWLKEGVRKWTLCQNLRQYTTVGNRLKFAGKNSFLRFIFVRIEFGLGTVGLCLRVKPRGFHLCSSEWHQCFKNMLQEGGKLTGFLECVKVLTKPFSRLFS